MLNRLVGYQWGVALPGLLTPAESLCGDTAMTDGRKRIGISGLNCRKKGRGLDGFLVLSRVSNTLVVRKLSKNHVEKQAAFQASVNEMCLPKKYGQDCMGDVPSLSQTGSRKDQDVLDDSPRLIDEFGSGKKLNSKIAQEKIGRFTAKISCLFLLGYEYE
eukprot:jgi/Bigna1/127328/aug1.4_g2036